MKPLQIVVTIRDGALWAVHADTDEPIDVIVRDFDNIDAGDADPFPDGIPDNFIAVF